MGNLQIEFIFQEWFPSFITLILVSIFGLFLLSESVRLVKARRALRTRILVTGSRGKSGTIRILHSLFLLNNIPVYSKITGTTAVELFPDEVEKPTTRLGTAGIPEMKTSMLKSRKYKVKVGIFESMAVTPKLIELVDRIIRPHISIIPTIRLDHTEEEGRNELEIAENILHAVRRSTTVFTAVDQPRIIARYQEMSKEHGFEIHFVRPSPDQPEIPGRHPTNVAIAIAIAKHLGLSQEGLEETGTLEPEEHIFHRMVFDGQIIELYDISGANDPQSAYEAFQKLSIPRDRLVIPVVVNRWERPHRGAIFSRVFEDYKPFVFRVGTVKRGNRPIGSSTQNYIPLGPERVLTTGTLRRFINSNLPEVNTPNVALVLFANVHEPSADRIRSLFWSEGEVIEQVGN